jgi:hypothetical protein
MIGVDEGSRIGRPQGGEESEVPATGRSLAGRGRGDLLLWLLLGGWGAVLSTMLAAGSLVVPYFLAPGAGVVVLAVSAAVARARRELRLARSSSPGPG